MNDDNEHVRSMLMYAICLVMAESGLLEFVGAADAPSGKTVLLFKNPDTGNIVEICKPALTSEDEQAVKDHIRQLLAAV